MRKLSPEGSERLIERCQCISIKPPENNFDRAKEIINTILNNTKETTGNYPFEYIPKSLIGVINVYPYGFSQGESPKQLSIAMPSIQSLITQLTQLGCEIEFIEKI